MKTREITKEMNETNRNMSLGLLKILYRLFWSHLEALLRKMDLFGSVSIQPSSDLIIYCVYSELKSRGKAYINHKTNHV